MNLHLLTFGGGDQNFLDAAGRLSRDALMSGLFKTVHVETSVTLPINHEKFWRDWESFIKIHPRIYGLGVWRPFLISRHLSSIPKNHILLYLDAGCVLNTSQSARRRFRQLYEMADLASSLSVELDRRHFGWSYSSFEERKWSKRELLDHLNLSEVQRNTNQRQSGILFFKHDAVGSDFVSEWLKLSTMDFGFFLTDDCDVSFQEAEFVAHRHEQSTFSSLSKVYDFAAIPDCTWHAPLWHWTGRKEPIWAARWRRGDHFGLSNPGVLRSQLGSLKSEMLYQMQRRA